MTTTINLPPRTTTLDVATDALRKVEDLVQYVIRGDSDGATRAAEETIVELASVVRDFGLELAEILPRAQCANCGRMCVDYREVRSRNPIGERTDGKPEPPRVMCAECAHEQISQPNEARPHTRAECLRLAAEAVASSPERYRDPRPGFARIAALWSSILGRTVTASDVALCMIAVKVSRLVDNPRHLDSWVDVAGYGACGAEVSP